MSSTAVSIPEHASSPVAPYFVADEIARAATVACESSAVVILVSEGRNQGCAKSARGQTRSAGLPARFPTLRSGPITDVSSTR